MPGEGLSMQMFALLKAGALQAVFRRRLEGVIMMVDGEERRTRHSDCLDMYPDYSELVPTGHPNHRGSFVASHYSSLLNCAALH